MTLQWRSLELTVLRLPISPMTLLPSLVGPYPTGIIRLVLDEMFSAIIRPIRVTAAVLGVAVASGKKTKSQSYPLVNVSPTLQ